MSKQIKFYRFQIINHDKKRYTFTDIYPGKVPGNIEVLPIQNRKLIPNNGYSIKFN